MGYGRSWETIEIHSGMETNNETTHFGLQVVSWATWLSQYGKEMSLSYKDRITIKAGIYILNLILHQANFHGTHLI